MERRTITERVRRAKDPKQQINLILEWLDAWQSEQKKLCDRLSLAVNIRDFDEACIVNGSLREVTNKKFTAFYNVLRVVGLPEQAENGGTIYAWGKYQTGLVAIMGRRIAAEDWKGVAEIYRRFESVNRTDFKKAKEILGHADQQPANVKPTAKSTTPKKFILSADIDNVVAAYNSTGTLRETAKVCGINPQKVRKILITKGAYESDIAQTVSELKASGLADAEIATRMNISVSAVNSYLPYGKGIYKSSTPSKNALAIRLSRNNPPVISDRKEGAKL